MFRSKQALKKFHVSTSRVYITGRKTGLMSKLLARQYTKRPVYRISGALLAL